MTPLTAGVTVVGTAALSDLSAPDLSNLPAPDRASTRTVKSRPAANASRAAWLVLLTQDEGTRALLFNAEQRYLAEVIDDPLTVEHLCAAGRPCAAPAGLLLDKIVPDGTAVAVRCFSLGHH